jgi:hypothetical protein
MPPGIVIFVIARLRGVTEAKLDCLEHSFMNLRAALLIFE